VIPTITTTTNIVRSQAVLDVRRAADQRLESTVRLASGSRFSSGREDSGAVSVHLKLRSSARSAEVQQRNLTNALSYLQAQEAGISEVWNALERIGLLGSQMRDVTQSLADLDNYMAEVNKLRAAIGGAQLASFNDRRLFVDYQGTSVAETMLLPIGDSGQTMEMSQSDFSAGSAANAWNFLLGMDGAYTGMGTDTADGLVSFVEGDGFKVLEEGVQTMLAANALAQERVNLALDHVRNRGRLVDTSAANIGDTDVAYEVARLGRSTMRMEASAAVLTQANVFGEVAVRLLGDGILGTDWAM
jgi:flagellin-like hook-associated protein FlgL